MGADHLPFTVLLQIVMLAILVLLLKTFFFFFLFWKLEHFNRINMLQSPISSDNVCVAWMEYKSL